MMSRIGISAIGAGAIVLAAWLSLLGGSAAADDAASGDTASASSVRVAGRELRIGGVRAELRTWRMTETHEAAGVPAVVERMLGGLEAAGYNTVQLRSSLPDAWLRTWLTALTERGMHAIVVLPEPGDAADAWMTRVEAVIGQWGGFESVVIWSVPSPAAWRHPARHDPRLVGRAMADPRWASVLDERWRSRLEAAEGLIDRVRALTDRPVMVAGSGPIGDIYAVGNRLGWMAFQEQSEWLREWSRSGTMPVLISTYEPVSAGMFFRGRTGERSADLATEPLVTEYAAMVMGPDAYREEQDDYRKLVEGHFIADQRYRSFAEASVLWRSPAAQSVMSEVIGWQLPAWREAGIAGLVVDHGLWAWEDDRARLSPAMTRLPRDAQADAGGIELVPDYLWKYLRSPIARPTPAGEALRRWMQPTLLWVRGPMVRGAIDQTRHFEAGEQVRREVVLINGTREAEEFLVDATVMLGGIQARLDTVSGELMAGERLRVPVRVKASDLGKPATGSMVVAGRIGRAAEVGEGRQAVEMGHQIWPRRPRSVRGGVLVFDPIGETKRMLERAGYQTEAWNGEPSRLLLVIGAGAMSAEAPLPGDLQAFVKGGGRVVMFAQDRSWVESVGLRVSPRAVRRVWMVDARHPVVEGLHEDDLAFWSGEPDEQAERVAMGERPLHGYRLNNRNAIATVVPEKPHYSAWRPILQCGFDQAYAPMMELDIGLGRMVWCQLELQDYVETEPIVVRLTERLVHYAGTAPLAPRRDRTMYVGDASGEALLKQMGVRFTTGGADEVSGADVLVLGPGADLPDSLLAEMVGRGGRMIVMARQEKRGPLGVRRMRMRGASPAKMAPEWQQTRGLGVSELRWRVNRSGWLLQSSADFIPAASGQLAHAQLGSGNLIVTQISPATLNADEQTYLRLTRWRQCRAIVQLLSNAGASFDSDPRIFGQTKDATPFYHEDYRAELELGDDPYRWRP